MPVDLSGPLYNEYKRARKRAEEAERHSNLGEAAAAYRQAAELMRKYARTSPDSVVRRQRLDRADALENIAKRMDQLSDHDLRSADRAAVVVNTAEDEDDYEAQVMSLIQDSSVQWQDIGGLKETISEIKVAYGLALARKPKGVQISSWRNLLLYGPPGTGKTLLAAATAGNLDASFFNVKVSNLLSKYFGESTKLISALFRVARRLSPSVIFLDEFESLTPPRGSGESGAERRIVSTFLAELDGMQTKDDASFVLTIGASNAPWLLDSAILSRFQRRIYVPLPDEAARQAILEIHLNRRGHHSQAPLSELVQRTQGFSGREIEQLCQLAVTHMTRRLNPDLEQMVDQGYEQVGAYTLKIAQLSRADLDYAFAQVKPVANAEMINRFNRWTHSMDQ